MKHTKGPWKIKTFSDFDGAIEIRAKDTRLVYLMEKPDSEDEANAKLIAAAPEMLEALEMILDPKFRNETGWTNIRRIIKKTKGEL